MLQGGDLLGAPAHGLRRPRSLRPAGDRSLQGAALKRFQPGVVMLLRERAVAGQPQQGKEQERETACGQNAQHGKNRDQ